MMLGIVASPLGEVAMMPRPLPGALAEYLLIENAVRGQSIEVIPAEIPFEVAALNEPMAVARHGVNQTKPRPTQTNYFDF